MSEGAGLERLAEALDESRRIEKELISIDQREDDKEDEELAEHIEQVQEGRTSGE